MLDEDTLLYSSDDEVVSVEEFTPTILTDLTFSTADENKFFNDRQIITTSMMIKLNLMSERMSGIELMLKKLIFTCEQNQTLLHSLITKMHGNESDHVIRDHCHRTRTFLSDSFIQGTDQLETSGSQEENTRQQRMTCCNFGVKSHNPNKNNKMLHWLVAFFVSVRGLYQQFTRRVHELHGQPKCQTPHVIKRLKIPDDVKIALELEKAKKIQANYSRVIEA
jgi:hypothetical protein